VALRLQSPTRPRIASLARTLVTGGEIGGPVSGADALVARDLCTGGAQTYGINAR